MTVNTASNRYSCSNFIVAPTISEGANYTTITSALAAASSGDTIFIKPGTYTEDITLKAGVNLTAMSIRGERALPSVEIVGKLSFSSAGVVIISHIMLTTNSDYILEITGSAASEVSLIHCFWNITDNNAISFTSSSASASISISDSIGGMSLTSLAFYVSTSVGTLNIMNTQIGGSSTTASTNSAGSINISTSFLTFPVSTTGTGTMRISNSRMETDNVTCVTYDRVGAVMFFWQNYFSSGTASAIDIVNGKCVFFNNTIESSNTNAVTGSSGTYQAGMSEYVTSLISNASVNTPLPLRVTQGGLEQSSYGTSAQVLTSSGDLVAPIWTTAPGVVLGTPQATTSGSSIDFTSIPDGVKRILVNLSLVSVSAAVAIGLQLGDSGGLETSGYTGATTDFVSPTGWTSSILCNTGGAAANLWSGILDMILINPSTNLWAIELKFYTSTVTAGSVGSGVKSLSSRLTQVSLIPVGVATFDNGEANITYFM